jgi:hypothetical protein
VVSVREGRLPVHSALTQYTPCTLMLQLMRSEVPAQKMFGMRLLAGALQRRELVVALEAYGSSTFRGADGERPAAGRDASMNALFASSFDLSLADFEREIVKALSATGSNEFADARALLLDMRLRRLVVYTLMQLVASDFPLELAFLVHREVTASSVLRNRIMSLELLRSYAYSPLEELAAVRLATRSGVWAIFGCPSFMMPQARRSEHTYGEQISSCLLKKSSALEDIEGRAEATEKAAYSVIELFALNYRWCRLGSMFADGGGGGGGGELGEALFGYVRGASGAFAWLEKEIIKLKSSPKGSDAFADFCALFDSRWAAAVQLASASLDVLNAAARSALTAAGGARSDTLKSRLVIHFSKTYDVVSDLMMGMLSIEKFLDVHDLRDGAAKPALLVLTKMGSLCGRWWRLVQGMAHAAGFGVPCFSRKASDSGKSLLLHRAFTIVVKSLRPSHVLLSSGELGEINEEQTLWAIKIVHESLVFGIGLDILNDIMSVLFPADRVGRCGGTGGEPCCSLLSCRVTKILGSSTSCRKTAAARVSSDAIICAFVSLLEEAAKACAVVCTRWAAGASTRDNKFVCTDFVRKVRFTAAGAAGTLARGPHGDPVALLGVLTLSRALLRFGRDLLASGAGAGAAPADGGGDCSSCDIFSCFYRRSGSGSDSSASEVTRGVNNFISAVLGAGPSLAAEGGGCFERLVFSVAEVSQIHGNGLCATIDSLSKEDVEHSFAEEGDLRSEVLSIQSFVRTFLKSPSVVQYARGVLSIVRAADPLSLPRAPAGAAGGVQLFSDFNVAVLSEWEQTFCLLRAARSCLPVVVAADTTNAGTTAAANDDADTADTAAGSVQWAGLAEVFSAMLSRMLSDGGAGGAGVCRGVVWGGGGGGGRGGGGGGGGGAVAVYCQSASVQRV